MITISEIEKTFGSPAIEWAGHCYGVALAAAQLIEGATAVYGHYLGAVAHDTLFSTSPGFVQHGWVLLDDGRVLDPTRWAFEGVDPYLYTAAPGDEYDEGGNQLRRQLQGDAPLFDPTGRVISITQSMLPREPWNWMESILNLQDQLPSSGYEPGDVGIMQLVWVANTDPRGMGVDGEHAVAIYTMLEYLDQGALIPLDNERMVAAGRHRRNGDDESWKDV